MTHPFTRVTPPWSDTQVEIDVELVPLLRSIWEAGYETRYSCQGDPGEDETLSEAYIAFPNATDAAVVAKALGYGDLPVHNPEFHPKLGYVIVWQDSVPEAWIEDDFASGSVLRFRPTEEFYDRRMS